MPTNTIQCAVCNGSKTHDILGIEVTCYSCESTSNSPSLKQKYDSLKEKSDNQSEILKRGIRQLELACDAFEKNSEACAEEYEDRLKAEQKRDEAVVKLNKLQIEITQLRKANSTLRSKRLIL